MKLSRVSEYVVSQGESGVITTCPMSLIRLRTCSVNSWFFSPADAVPRDRILRGVARGSQNGVER